METPPHERTPDDRSVSPDVSATDVLQGPARSDLERAIDRARRHVLGLQQPEGCWCGELEGDTILESEYILLLAWLGQLDRPEVAQAARYVLSQQRRPGGWALFPDGELNVSASVKAYFALKLAGQSPRSEPMRLAREAILAHGGADRVNSFTRYYLALLGQIPYDACPAVPPEAILLPAWSPLNIYRISAWSRTMFVPLSIIWAYRPVRAVPVSLGVSELFVRPVEQWPPLQSPGDAATRSARTWVSVFRGLDRALKWAERWRLCPLRRRALREAERWITDRFVDSDGLGAIFPPIVWSLVALKCLGYADESPEVRYCHEQLEDLTLVQHDTLRLQPCKSPVWDTALTLRALAAAPTAALEEPVRQATQWLLTREAVRRGDWAATVRAEPGGWYFEHHNAFYPDLDDTAVVLTALREHYLSDQSALWDGPRRLVIQATAANMAAARDRAALLDRTLQACERARRWVLAMQNADGGWGAFDKDNDAEFLCHVPFADHNAMIDPSTPDITARVLEALAAWGATRDDVAVERAIHYLRATQEDDGSWYGRWGVNYVYGTWQCLVGLTQVGVPPEDDCVQRGAQWLLAHQQPGGGWGETPESYTQPRLRGQGRATASQTSWALLGLLAAGYHEHPAVPRGIEYLLRQQRDDGGWAEPEFTGTGFPRVFYLRYHLYPLYFPLLALARYCHSLGPSAR